MEQGPPVDLPQPPAGDKNRGCPFRGNSPRGRRVVSWFQYLASACSGFIRFWHFKLALGESSGSPLRAARLRASNHHFGQSHPNVPAVRQAKINPSIVALMVVSHERRYQMDMGQIATE